MATNRDVLSTVIKKIRVPEVNAIFQRTAALAMMERRKMIKREAFGHTIQCPVILGEHSSLTAHTTGYESQNLSVADTLDLAVYTGADVSAPIFITRKDELENKGDQAVLNVAKVRVKGTLEMVRRHWNAHYLKGTAPGSTANIFAAAGMNSLYGHATAAGTYDKFIQGLAPASQTGTIGGLARSAARGWQNGFVDIGDDFSLNGLDAAEQLWHQVEDFAPGGTPTWSIWSSQGFRNYKAIISPQERWSPKDKLDAGRMALEFDGIEAMRDKDMATSGVNDQEFTVIFGNDEAIEMYIHPDADFDIEPFEKVTGDQVGMKANFYTKLQVVCKSPAGLGVGVDGNIL